MALQFDLSMHFSHMCHTATDQGSETSIPLSPIPPNFPFGLLQEKANCSLRLSHQLPVDRDNARSLVNSYLATFEQAYRIIHVPTFLDEVNAYWIDPMAMEQGWMAQYLTILGLGNLVQTPAWAPETSGHEKRYSQLFEQAQAYLMQTPFLSSPTLATIRTLCLMTIAKEAYTMSCRQSDASWSMMGLISRLAMTMGLHLERPEQDGRFESEIRRRLWTTIVYLDIQQSVRTGTPLSIHLHDFTSLCPTNCNDADFGPNQEFTIDPALISERTDTSYQVLLYQSLPILFPLISRLNSPSIGLLTYEEAVDYDKGLREFLQGATTFRDEDPQHWQLPDMTTDIFFRSILLSLHRQFAQQPDCSERFPTSYWASLECSLALLVHQHSCANRENSWIQSWFMANFGSDFFPAALTACMHLLSRGGTFGPVADRRCSLPARQTIVNALGSFSESLSRMKDLSPCVSRGTNLISQVIAFLGVNAELELEL